MNVTFLFLALVRQENGEPGIENQPNFRQPFNLPLISNDRTWHDAVHQMEMKNKNRGNLKRSGQCNQTLKGFSLLFNQDFVALWRSGGLLIEFGHPCHTNGP